MIEPTGVFSPMRILVVDDEPNIRAMLRVALESQGCEVAQAAGLGAARGLLKRESFDVAFVDVRLKQENGLELLDRSAGAPAETAVVVMTAYASIPGAVMAMREGAFDYLPKPFKPDDLRLVLGRVERLRGLRHRVFDLEQRLAREIPEARLGSDDSLVTAVENQAKRVATTDAAVLIRGESGVGKGVLARAIHAWSSRANGPFVTVSCPSLTGELLESDLFGHAKGAFTSAIADVAGKVETAQGGTLFLDEIGDRPGPLQPKLLRFLQDKQYERLGETRVRSADVRLIAATNHDLDAAVAGGRFREDLFFRLSVVELVPPPLRDRSDRLVIAGHLLQFFSRQLGKTIGGFSPSATAAILAYAWPGNLRELRNAVERAVIFASSGEISLADLPDRVVRGQRDGESAHAPRVELGGPVTLVELECEHIRRVLAAHDSLEKAAEILGIDKSTLYRKRRSLGL